MRLPSTLISEVAPRPVLVADTHAFIGKRLRTSAVPHALLASSVGKRPRILDGIVGWSEFDEGFGSPGVGAVIERFAARVVGQDVFDHERIYAELYYFTRPAAGGVVREGLGAIENALLDAKAKALGVPFLPELNVDQHVLRNLRTHLAAIREGAGPVSTCCSTSTSTPRLRGI
jgi:hypothetical protein